MLDDELDVVVFNVVVLREVVLNVLVDDVVFIVEVLVFNVVVFKVLVDVVVVLVVEFVTFCAIINPLINIKNIIIIEYCLIKSLWNMRNCTFTSTYNTVGCLNHTLSYSSPYSITSI